MARGLNRLSARQVDTLKEAGRHADGGGLYLRISASGARSWGFMYNVAGKRTELGLGSVSSVRLAQAREWASEMRAAVAGGTDPRHVLARHRSPPPERPSVPTFGVVAEAYIAGVEAGWKNPIHRKQWRQTLRDHAAALSEKLITDITTEDVAAVLRPIWLTKAETAKRLRGRIEKILDAAKALGHRPESSINPAMWRGHLQLRLPSQSNVQRGHHAALPWKEAPAFMVQLRARPALAARCLEFVILTAARSGEALGATWSELDLKGKLWTVPAARMKARKEHVVPLASAAVELLTALKSSEAKSTDRVFGIGGAARSNMAMAMLLRRMGRADLTTHGFRSTFRDWAGDDTSFPRELIEHALAHAIGDKAEAAYRRGNALDRRRLLMEHWAAFLAGLPPPKAEGDKASPEPG